MVAPSQRALERALDFARGQSDWIATQLARVPVPVPLAVGAAIPLRGQEHAVREGASGRGAVWVEDGTIRVAGRREHHARRILDFLKREARKELEARTQAFGARIGLKHKRITVRDTASRWGSCSAGRSLSFSWRLILAPAFVLDYVVAHEVAHMREMNHGPRFWRVVHELVGDPRRPQKWLHDQGAMLHRYAPKGA